ncbi:hypothetical protein Q0N71_31660 [Bacillus thuringiensis]|uniref:hypothetical protein n=1 Tax=Bacillus thuringiensis TaxID=1428 RepID=UPI003457C7DB
MQRKKKTISIQEFKTSLIDNIINDSMTFETSIEETLAKIKTKLELNNFAIMLMFELKSGQEYMDIYNHWKDATKKFFETQNVNYISFMDNCRSNEYKFIPILKKFQENLKLDKGITGELIHITIQLINARKIFLIDLDKKYPSHYLTLYIQYQMLNLKQKHKIKDTNKKEKNQWDIFNLIEHFELIDDLQNIYKLHFPNTKELWILTDPRKLVLI